MKHILFILLLFTVSLHAAPVNILIITVDDMSADSVGAFGCKLPGTTPNIDRLAGQSLSFAHAHMTVGNCMPGRNVMFSGLISHNNKVCLLRNMKNTAYQKLKIN